MTDILKSQAEYRARKWSVGVNVYDQFKGGFSGHFRFETFAEAVEYLRNSAMINSSYRDKRWEMSGPGGRFDAADVASLIHYLF